MLWVTQEKVLGTYFREQGIKAEIGWDTINGTHSKKRGRSQIKRSQWNSCTATVQKKKDCS